MTQVFIGKIGPNGLFDADTEQEAMSLLPLNFDYNTLNIRPAPAPAPELAQPELAQPALAPELAQPELAQPALAPIPIQSDPITAGDGDRKMENPINAASVDQQRLNDLQKKALTERLQQLYSGRAQLLLPNADTPSVKEVVTSPEPTNEFKNLLFPHELLTERISAQYHQNKNCRYGSVDIIANRFHMHMPDYFPGGSPYIPTMPKRVSNSRFYNHPARKLPGRFSLTMPMKALNLSPFEPGSSHPLIAMFFIQKNCRQQVRSHDT